MAMVGVAMIMYALWMFMVWQKHVQDSDHPVPWFIYTFLGLGATLCVLTCSGHIAAETINGCCLYIYMVFIFLLVMFEAAITVDVFLNRNWEEDFPEDPTGNFKELEHFIKENFEICKWIGLSIVAVQGICMLLALTLKALGPYRERCYDSDDDYTPEGVPLLKNYVHRPPYGVAGPVYPSHNDSWKIRVDSKVNR